MVIYISIKYLVLVMLVSQRQVWLVSSCQLSGGGRMLAWANSHHRCVVRFDPRPFGSDAPSQPRRGVYVKERSFAFLPLIQSKIIHNTLWHTIIVGQQKSVLFLLPLKLQHKKGRLIAVPFHLNLEIININRSLWYAILHPCIVARQLLYFHHYQDISYSLYSRTYRRYERLRA